MTITIGPAVTGEDFFDREDIITEMWEILKKGSILLKAPRRVGKNWVNRTKNHLTGLLIHFRMIFI